LLAAQQPRTMTASVLIAHGDRTTDLWGGLVYRQS
jgi:hypothetical protein